MELVIVLFIVGFLTSGAATFLGAGSNANKWRLTRTIGLTAMGISLFLGFGMTMVILSLEFIWQPVAAFLACVGLFASVLLAPKWGLK
ncbi:hypothetical protein KUW09_17100 [Mameliella alba]|nr:hypothetical protein [Antarctobacter heliothermus]MBY6145776.1 hypothetical protein [Mameliella alba]MCA0954807.1 hypothetical protein [Mameliella alba]